MERSEHTVRSDLILAETDKIVEHEGPVAKSENTRYSFATFTGIV